MGGPIDRAPVTADDAGMFGIDLPDWLEWLHWALRIKNALIIALIVFVVVSAIVKARDSDKLVFYPDGSINVEASDARRAEMTDPAKQRPTPRRPDPAGLAQALVADGDARQPERATSYAQARAMHEVLKAQERQLKLGKQRGELVDRSRAVALVFRLARQERDAWLNWPARVSALMAGELGVDVHVMQELLDRHVRQHLGDLAEFRVDLH